MLDTKQQVCSRAKNHCFISWLTNQQPRNLLIWQYFSSTSKKEKDDNQAHKNIFIAFRNFMFISFCYFIIIISNNINYRYRPKRLYKSLKDIIKFHAKLINTSFKVKDKVSAKFVREEVYLTIVIYDEDCKKLQFRAIKTTWTRYLNSYRSKYGAKVSTSYYITFHGWYGVISRLATGN